MDMAKLIGASADGALPEEIAPIVAALIEGRLTQFAVIAETTEGRILSAYPMIDHETANVFAMVGALEMVKRDYMRSYVDSRVTYIERDEE